MTKKFIIDPQCTVSCYELDGTLKKLQDWVTDQIAHYGDSASLSWQPNHWEAYDSSPSPRFEIQISRLETDDEYAARLQAATQRLAEQAEQERKEFERLALKFGKK